MQFLYTILLLTTFASYTSSQATHTITVGVKGSFYDPPTTNALEGDIINFVFGGVIHGVTQSSFSQPCSPLSGGFSSGLLGTNGTTTVSPPIWNLVISNASEPIWFFCEATRPESHCASGMVGAINAPADMFLSFQSAAKAVTGTPAPTPTVILSGIGAFATASPTTFSIPSSSLSDSTLSPSSSSGTPSSLPSSPSVEPIKKSFPTGAVAGGVAAGCVALVIIAVLLVLLRRQKKKRLFEGQEYAKEKEQRSLSTPIVKRGVLEPISGSDLSDSETSRGGARLLRQASSSGISSTIDGLDREAAREPFGANDVDVGKIFNRGVTQDHSVQRRYANHQRSFSPITTADAFSLSPTPHPYAQSQYNQQPSPPTGTSDRTASNVHEIAKEVAALLQSGNTVPPGLSVSAAADPKYAHGRPPRQLPNPRHFLKPSAVPEEPESPGLPRYER